MYLGGARSRAALAALGRAGPAARGGLALRGLGGPGPAAGAALIEVRVRNL